MLLHKGPGKGPFPGPLNEFAIMYSFTYSTFFPPLPKRTLRIKMGLPRWSAIKGFTYNAGDTGDAGSIPGLGRFPGGGNGNPFQYSCLENPMDKRSLVGYSPWGCKESDMTQ